MWLTALHFVSGNNDVEDTGDSGPLEEWTRGRAYRIRCHGKPQLHLPQFFQRRFCRRKQANTVCKKLGRDLAATPHQFVNRRGEMKSIFVKLDRQPVTHAQHVSVVFAAVCNAVLGEQLRVDLVPPRLGIGEHAIKIEDYGAKRWRHGFAAPLTHLRRVSNSMWQIQRLSQKREPKILCIFKRLALFTVFRFVLMEPNRGALISAVQLEQPVNSPIYNARQHVTEADRPLRVSFDFLCSPTVAVIGSALLMMLIGWIDYATDFNVTVFY